ncbi:contractile injection system protein, VgrG/Pvc8 family [Burkholderia sp. Bp9090]|uniref:contractile injection system protein, VgrG/Pvc8 family n=1 Tax=Burkholderia sp. Bp9090 TaxID=2184567 RepID=UPI0021AB7E4F|nr:contractile injection system protein, VgrG/Pvc8 family [Burkholderia sp. Bp9090]
MFAFRHIRTDGGWVFYEAHVGPWLRYLKYSQHNRLFLDQNLHDQTATIFQDYGALPEWDWQVGEDDPRMTMACQFDEDDHNYVHRRWEHAGYLYWYEHTATSHKLTVSDPTRCAHCALAICTRTTRSGRSWPPIWFSTTGSSGISRRT